MYGPNGFSGQSTCASLLELGWNGRFFRITVAQSAQECKKIIKNLHSCAHRSLRIVCHAPFFAHRSSRIVRRALFVVHLSLRIICRKSFVAHHLSRIIRRSSCIINHASFIMHASFISHHSFHAFYHLLFSLFIIIIINSQIKCNIPAHHKIN